MDPRLAATLTGLLGAVALMASPRAVVVPAGTAVHFKLKHSISTASARVGDEVPATLTSPLVASGATVAAAGSHALVRINNVESSGRVGGSARLSFSLVSITLAGGNSVTVRTSSYSREGRAHAKHNATYIAGGAIVGALAGQAIGGNGRSTEKGAAIGAGVGIGAAAASGKFDFEEPAGARFTVKLKTAIHVSI